VNDPVMALGLVAFGLLLLVLPLSFWALSGQHNSPVVRLLVAGLSGRIISCLYTMRLGIF
jgi:hypothetical protein